MANNIIEYRTITPTTIVPTTPEILYLTVTYLVSEGNLTIPITNNPSGIKSIIIDGGKKLIWKTPQSATLTFTTPGEHNIEFILENDTTLTSGMFSGITSIVDILLPKSITTIPEGSLSNTHIKSLIIPEGVVWNHDSFPYLEHLEVYGTLSGGNFSGNSKLKTIIIGKTGVLGGGCLTGPKTLDKVYIDGQFAGGGNFSGTNYIKELIFGENFRGSNTTGNFSGTIIDSVIVNTTLEAFDIYLVGSGAYPRRIEFHCKKVNNSALSPSFNSSLEEVIFGNEVEEILPNSNNYYFFNGNSCLISLILGKGLKELPSFFVQGCANLTYINIPSNIKELNLYTFNTVGTNGDLNIVFNGPITLKAYSIVGHSKLSNLTFYPESKLENLCVIPTPTSLTFYDGGKCILTRIGSVFVDSSNTKEVKYEGTEKITNGGNFSSTFNASDCTVNFGEEVSKIADKAFYYFVGLKYLYIPETITHIGKEAFYNNSGLQHITIKSKKIGEEAFKTLRSSALKIVNIDSEIVGKKAFYECNSSTFLLNFSKNLYKIEDEAFKYCTLNNTSINLYNCKIIGKEAFKCGTSSGSSYSYRINLNNVEEIGDEAFSGYYSTTGLAGPCILTNIKSIGNKAFYESRITKLVLGKNLKTLGEYAFGYCSDITGSVNIPGSIKIVPKRCFDYCSNIETIILEDGITTIDDYVFNQCSKLKRLEIPDSVTYIGEGAFLYCSNSNLNIKMSNNIEYIGPNAFNGVGWFYSLPSNSTTQYGSVILKYDNSSTETNIVIPEGITQIYEDAFRGMSNLETITLPKSLLFIEDNAFQNCTSLTSIIIPDKVESIKTSTFSGCTNLESVTIPDGVKSIGNNAFNNCDGLSSITIPDSVISIDSYAFLTCDNLTNVNLSSNVTEIKSNTFYHCDNLESINLDNVIYIRDYAFRYCSNLNIDIPSNCKSIGQYAFSESGVLSITIPLGCSIYKGTFSKCDNLTSVNNVLNLAQDTFRDCINLTSLTISANFNSSTFENSALYNTSINSIVVDSENTVYDSRDNCNAIIKTSNNSLIRGCAGTTIPDSVTSIGLYAFSYCKGLLSIIIPNTVTTISNYAFQNSTDLVSITLPNGITQINPYTFYLCTNLISITIPDSVLYIGDTYAGQVFYLCTSLSSVTISSNIKSIGRLSFYGCTSLESVIIKAITPPSLENLVFDNNAPGRKIYVPANSVATYKAASGWSTYADDIEAIPTE